MDIKERIDVNECKKVLEAAIGETGAIIPDEILQATLFYLTEYKRLKSEMSWIECPESMY